MRVDESTDDELDAVLLAVARWAVTNGLPERCVLVDGEPVELPEPPGGARSGSVGRDCPCAYRNGHVPRGTKV